MDSYSVGQSHHPQNPATHPLDPAPIPNASIRLILAAHGSRQNLLAPFGPKIRPLAQHLFDK